MCIFHELGEIYLELGMRIIKIVIITEVTILAVPFFINVYFSYNNSINYKN